MRNKRLSGLTGHLVFAIAASTLGSSFQHGYNIGVVNTPHRLVEDFINVSYRDRYSAWPTVSTVTLIFSVSVSVFCVGGLLGFLSAEYLADRFGRRRGLLWNNALVFVAAAFMGFAKMARSYELLIAGRLIIGFNSGLNSGLAPMYLTEISPASLRGTVASAYPLMVAVSIFISQLFGLPQILGTERRWPILYGLIVVPAVFMLITLPQCPESPKYKLFVKGEETAAKEALKWLRNSDNVRKEIRQMKAENQKIKNRSKVKLKDFFRTSKLRNPFVIALVIMLSQQFSGVPAVVLYSFSLFGLAGLSDWGAAYSTLATACVRLVAGAAAVVLVDKFGHRTLLLAGLAGMAVCAVMLTACLAIVVYAEFLSFVSVISVIGFIVMFQIGPGAFPRFLVPELLSQNARPMATRLIVSLDWLSNFVISLAYLPIAEVTGDFTFLIFTAFIALFFIFTYFKVPETKG